ncbi:uncharacterized protein LOC143289490 [Babylonia areolata]|uniref:uncharacterized protein LOC143289490 n=1 Tax=Babylonia areolata TaxID=304850 RepID=UPI003FD682AF
MSIPVSAFLLVFLAALTPADSSTCKILRYGKLTMFSAEEQNVQLPCKYRLADFTCGGYKITVTAGSSLDGKNRFSPSSVRVKLIKDSTKWIGFTNTNRLQEETGWDIQTNDLPVDSAGHDSATQSVVLEKTGVFKITFSNGDDDDGVTVTCSDATQDFSAGAYPSSLCGSLTTGVVAARKNELFTDDDPQTDGDRDRAILHDILNDNLIVQSPQCQAEASDFQACPGGKKAEAARLCGPIFTARALAGCLNGAHFRTCLSAVCSDDVASSRALIEALMECQIPIAV